MGKTTIFLPQLLFSILVLGLRTESIASEELSYPRVSDPEICRSGSPSEGLIKRMIAMCKTMVITSAESCNYCDCNDQMSVTSEQEYYTYEQLAIKFCKSQLLRYRKPSLTDHVFERKSRVENPVEGTVERAATGRVYQWPWHLEDPNDGEFNI